MSKQKNIPPMWPEMPHTIDSWVQAIRNNTKTSGFSASALHLQLPSGRFVKGDMPEALESMSFKPRPDVEEFDLLLPFNWTVNPYGDPSWQMQLNSCRFLDRFLNGYEKTGATEFLHFPLKAMLDWHDFHIQNNKGDHKFALDDMTGGIRATRFAFLAAKISDGVLLVSDDDLVKVVEVLLFHWSLFTREGYFKFTNHTLSALHGLVSLFRVAYLEGESKQAWQEEFSGVLNQLADAQFDDEGIHLENSPEYHFFVLKLFSSLLKSGWYDEVPGRFHKKLQLAQQRGPWLRFPDGRALPFGDTNGALPPRQGLLKARFFNEPEVLNHRCYHVSRCVDGDAWSVLAFKSGHERETHRHEDDLSFVWSESGHDIIIDPGKYAYKLDRFRSFVKNASSHNTIDFVKSGKSARGAPSDRLPIVIQHGGYTEIQAETFLNSPSAHVVRRFFFLPGRALLVVDRFSSDEADEFTSRTSFGADFSFDLENGIRAMDERGSSVHCVVYSSVPVVTRYARGMESPQMEGWVSRGYKKIEPCPTLAVSGTAKDGLIATAYVIDGESSIHRNGNVITWVGESWCITVPDI